MKILILIYSSYRKEKENIKLLKRKGKQLDAEQIKIEHEIEEIERKNFFIHEIGIFSKKLDNFADLISRKKLIVEKFKKDLQSAEKKSVKFSPQSFENFFRKFKSESHILCLYIVRHCKIAPFLRRACVD